RLAPSVVGYAVLRGQSNASWSSDSISVGDLLPKGVIELEEGIAHLEFLSGVQMVIEGHSRFEIQSPMLVTMEHGRARAQVPEPAQGFEILTRSGKIIDLGTEFAVDINENESLVHVIDGEVELQAGNETERVLVGSTKSLLPSGRITTASMSRVELIGPSDFRDLAREQMRERILGWESKLVQLTEDPRLVGCYQFSSIGDQPRMIGNAAKAHPLPATGGVIVAGDLASDRWGRTQRALDFGGIGSSVRVNVPGELRGLTLSCWVNIDSLDRWYNSLFLTDGHEDFEPHWQIMDDGRVFFSVKLPSPSGQRGPETQVEYYSPSIKAATTTGKWMMLSITYDVENECVKHFLNGEEISSQPIPADALIDSIRIGNASICNWNDPMYRTKDEWVLRNLNGTMDEFLVFEGALTPHEINGLFLVGNPNG
ncbi:MAG: LamG-like jellyroll fold domain-containing protein, partial [Planctomycetota bacterium]